MVMVMSYWQIMDVRYPSPFVIFIEKMSHLERNMDYLKHFEIKVA